MVALRPRDPRDVFQRALGMAAPVPPIAQDAAARKRKKGDQGPTGPVAQPQASSAASPAAAL